MRLARDDEHGVPSTRTSLLDVRSLTAGYGPVQVLRELDFHVDQGEVVVILGANGAGKTTTMRALSGTIPAAGSVLLDGEEVTRLAAEDVARRGVGHVPQGRGTFVDVSVRDNLRLGGHALARADVAAAIERWYGVFPRLRDRDRLAAGRLSGGEQQMLAIARALMARPRLLLLDEPSLGLAPIVTQELFGVLRSISRDEGVTLLMVEQNAGLALELADRAYVLEAGEIALSGSAGDLAADDAVRRAYLGY